MSYKQTSTKYHDAALWAWRKYSSSIFPCEDSFLHHLFFVNGNGYEWTKNGELVEMLIGNEPDCHPPLSFPEWGQAHSERSIYPICEYARCLSFPATIQPDWREALERALLWADGADHHTAFWDEETGRKRTRTNEENDHRFLEIARAKLAALDHGIDLRFVHRFYVKNTLSELLRLIDHQVTELKIIDSNHPFFHLEITVDKSSDRFCASLDGLQMVSPDD